MGSRLTETARPSAKAPKALKQKLFETSGTVAELKETVLAEEELPWSVSDGQIARKAVAASPAGKQENLARLRRIEGQVRGIAKMVEQDRYCVDIVMQVASVQEALRGVARGLMRNHLQHCATQALAGGETQREAMYDELLELIYKHLR